MLNYLKRLLSIPWFYHYVRQILLLGMPLKTWAEYGNYFKPSERIADLGCGPADILRYLDYDHKPSFYLGIDFSTAYLQQAELKANKLKLSAEFLTIDLSLLTRDPTIQHQLIEVFNRHTISTINLFGFIHHLDDSMVLSILETAYQAKTVHSLNTQDVLIQPRNPINNFYASLDRGDYVRTESQYDDLLQKSSWKKITKNWSHAGIAQVKYLHYRLSK